ncbi:MAG TPA: sulfite exporter TauE/SafE family protein [Pseudolabrys sp.]|nr:sulfite exporter TauE/SafE family protein [Pseudolabrys sp.]
MFSDYSLQTIAFLWVGTLVGAIAAGGAGFAFGLTASSIWLHRIDPLHSALLINCCGTMLHMTTIWPQRKHVEIRRVWPFVVGGLIGIPIGVRVLLILDAGMLKAALGAFLLVFGAYALLAPRIHTVAGGGRVADAGIGFIGGILSGVGGYSGVVPTIWTQLRGWPKQMARAVYQPYIIVIQFGTVVGIVWASLDRGGAHLLLLVLLVLPPLALGTWIGWQLYGRLNDLRFRQALAILLIASGATLVF